MTHAGHGIWKCSCGQVIKQCRCPDKNKPVHIVQNECDACHTMTTPTTGTAPLIERLVETVLIDLCTPIPLSPDEVRARLAAALGPDVIVIDREQARETIAACPDSWYVGDDDVRIGYDRADDVLAALAGEEDRP